MKPIIYWGALFQTAVACGTMNFLWALHSNSEGYGNLETALVSLCIAIFGSLIIYNWLIWGKPLWKDDPK